MKQTLHVEGMSCAHCVSSIEDALKEIDVKAQVDLNSKKVEVEFAGNQHSLAEIKETIKGLGYDVN